MDAARKVALVALLVLTAVPHRVVGQSWKSVLNLAGQWKFELGDDAKWSDPGFQDSHWDDIRVPSPWENQGYPGYDGYAWYRKHFTVDASLKDADLYLHVGYVDDVSEVYLNGHMIGFEGKFPPDYSTAYNITRPYRVPRNYFRYGGDNVVAVRVYDQRMQGGIVSGKVGLYEQRDYLEPDYDLEGVWQFATGDNPAWKEREVSGTKWHSLVVPGYWEGQGFRTYDGIAWYRLKFRVPTYLSKERLILLLGKIDDCDETYLNGRRIGRTGRIDDDVTAKNAGNSYAQLRAYVIPPDALSPDQENVIAVRVLDAYMHGGIYDGPIGLTTREHYLDWKKDNESGWDIFDWFR